MPRWLNVALVSCAVVSAAVCAVLVFLDDDALAPSDDGLARVHAAIERLATRMGSLETRLAEVERDLEMARSRSRAEAADRVRDEPPDAAREAAPVTHGAEIAAFAGDEVFGTHAPMVSAMTRALGLEVDQQFFYHELLVDFEGAVEELRRAIDPDDEDSGQQYLARLRELEETLDDRFVQGLTHEQSERYRALPESQRRPSGAGPRAEVPPPAREE